MENDLLAQAIFNYSTDETTNDITTSSILLRSTDGVFVCLFKFLLYVVFDAPTSAFISVTDIWILLQSLIAH